MTPQSGERLLEVGEGANRVRIIRYDRFGAYNANKRSLLRYLNLYQKTGTIRWNLRKDIQPLFCPNSMK